MPGEEDFGITAVEALASGKPVIALGRGGALETVPLTDPLGGLLYSDATDEALARRDRAVGSPASTSGATGPASLRREILGS